MRLSAVDPNGNFSTGRTKFLEESAVSPDPQIFLCDFHLRMEKEAIGLIHFTQVLSTETLRFGYVQHTGSPIRAWCPVRAEAV